MNGGVWVWLRSVCVVGGGEKGGREGGRRFCGGVVMIGVGRWVRGEDEGEGMEWWWWWW